MVNKLSVQHNLPALRPAGFFLSAIIHGLGDQGEKWLKSLRNKELILECLWDDKTL